jgi:hypothetical protein
MNTTPTAVNGTLDQEPETKRQFSFGYVRQDSGQAKAETELPSRRETTQINLGAGEPDARHGKS